MIKLRIAVLSALIVFRDSAGAWAVRPSVTSCSSSTRTSGVNSDMSAKIKLTQQKAGQGVKEFEFLFYRRDRDDAFLMIVTAPSSDAGNGYLRQGDNFWMYRQNTRTFQHINRDDDIEGTDYNSGDFESRKMSELYKAALDANGREIVVEEMLGDIKVYRIELVAKVNDVTYPKVTVWVRRDNYLPLKQQLYSLSGTLMYTSYYLKYTTVQGHYVCIKSMMIDEFEQGNKTVMEITGIAFNPIPDSYFTKAYLENLSR
jgi:outer membrane lipoprotein-sorting protein